MNDFDKLFDDDSNEKEQSGGDSFNYGNLLNNSPQNQPIQQQTMNHGEPQQNVGSFSQTEESSMFDAPNPANDYKVASTRQAFKSAFQKDENIPGGQTLPGMNVAVEPKRSFSEVVKFFWETNSKVYASLNIFQIFFILIGMGIAGYLLWIGKNFLVYMILYNAHYLSFFESLQNLMIFVVYALIVLGVFEILDGSNDKGRETLLMPFKFGLIGIGVLYLGDYLSFDQLFSLFYVCVLPLVFVKIFCFSEHEMSQAATETVPLAKNENVVALDNAENLIKTGSESFAIEMPEGESLDLLTEETDDEVEIYDLGAEMITASKQRNASAFLMTYRANISNPKIFYFDIETETEVLAQ